MPRYRKQNKNELFRKKGRREPYDRILIVCEGAKTEPKYLQELVDHLRLSSANVRISGEGGSAPISVVNDAIRLFDEEPDYDKVFCVFDKDRHSSFHQAKDKVEGKVLTRRAQKKKTGTAKLMTCVSVPCFEYWILLHYQYTTASLPAFADVERKLKCIPEHKAYQKGDSGLFGRTKHLLDRALANADKANRAAERTGTDNPTTQMPDLICCLQKLQDSV